MTDSTSMITFRTKDLNQAAFMWCQPGVKLKRLQGTKLSGMTIFFSFEMPMTEEELQSLQFCYANGETTVEPQTFIAKQNNLRDLLHSSLGIQVRRKEQDSEPKTE